MDRIKILFAAMTYLALMFTARVFADTNTLDVLSTGSDPQVGILTAMFKQLLNNPSSAVVIGALCVIAWLVDDLPFISSRYVAHIIVPLGAVTFRFFCLESSVPKYFPHPQAVFICNGIIAGFIAFVIHKQAVARLVNYFRVQGGTADPDQRPTQLKTPQS